ncbi:MAG TPA: YesL family protein [Bacillales bacterium]|nr:YesL family protein [Bacillales bacterium]
MEWKGIMGGLNAVMEWIMRLAYVNLLWIFFTLVGAIVFGMMPAAAGLFAVTRKWVMGETDVPVFRTFWDTYRSGFLKVNLLGLGYLAVGIIFYIDYVFIHSLGGMTSQILTVLLFSVVLLYLITFMYLFPVYVHFQLPALRYLKVSFLIGVANLPSTIIMAAGIVAVYLLLRIVPGMFLFFSGSLLSLIFMWAAYRAFLKLERQQRLRENGNES